jgi:hypothetical protein
MLHTFFMLRKGQAKEFFLFILEAHKKGEDEEK